MTSLSIPPAGRTRPRIRAGAWLRGLVAGALAALAAASPGTVAAAAPKFHLEEASLAQIQAALLGHRVTTEGLVRLYLARIKAYNGTCVKQPQGILGPVETIAHAGQINALSTLNLRPAHRQALGFDARKARSMTDAADSDPAMPDALEVAAAQDRELARTGKLVGPLQGMVMSIKDQYDTFDMRTTAGADADYANDRPPADATFVKRLRQAGAIILAKSNLAEYASGTPRSSFGGTFCNPYDTERTPNISSAGSGSSVGANLVTCAIAEETGSSIRGPAEGNSSVGIAPTEELVSRKGMMGAGINTRVGPICRNVEDAARILDVIAGYDPQDPLTVFGTGRLPPRPYASYARGGRLDGLRIGVVREYMDKALFTKADEQSIELVEHALDDLRKLGATVVDPGPGQALFTACLRAQEPQDDNKLFTRRFPERFPLDAQGKPAGDHIATLLDMTMDPSLVPDGVNLRSVNNVQGEGEGKFMLDLYLRQRGDANIRSNADLIAKSRFHQDPHFPDRKKERETAEKPLELSMADRMLRRFSVQQMILQCMQEQQLDALVYPTSNLPPRLIGSPIAPAVNGRSGTGVWSFLGAQGFPAITVPAGFTTEVYDWVRDPAAPPPAPAAGQWTEGLTPEPVRMVGPTPAVLPVGIDFAGRPFSEPVLLRIASAYAAATHHRVPPADFGPVAGEP